MRNPTCASIAIVAALIIGTCAIAMAHADSGCRASYSVIDIGTLGGSSAYTEGMNNRGEVVGYSFRSKDFTPRAFVWSRQHGMRELKGLTTSSGSFAFGINDREEIVGTPQTQAGDFHAVVWHRTDAPPLDLGTLTPQGLRSGARSINVWGQIVGISDITAEEDQRAFLWSPVTETMRDLGSLENNTTGSGAHAISNVGHIAGLSFVDGGEHAVLWIPWTRHIRDLGTLGADDSSAEAVNDLGDAAGQSSTTYDPILGTTPTHAFFWSRGRMHDLGTLGGTNSYAHGINNGRQVVGTSQATPGAGQVLGPYHAFLWSQGCGMQDLNGLISPAYGIVLSSAADINDRGRIAAEADLGDRTHSYLLKPISDSR